MQDLRMGYSQRDITPAFPVQMIGFNRADNTSQGIGGALYAQVAVWELGDELCCLIAIDHIGFSKAHANELREKAGRILSVSKEKVMLCFSHTHAAPNEDIETEYRQSVYLKVCDCVREAMKNLRPVHAGWGNAFGDIGFNRRKESESLDRRMGILKVTDAVSGELRLVLLRLTAHANVLKSDNYLISPDYFGAVRDMLKERYHCPIMITQGAAGNVAPKYVCTNLVLPDACDERVLRSQTAMTEMAREVDCQVQRVFGGIHPHPVQRICMYSKNIELHSEVPDHNRARQIAEEAYREAGIAGEAWLAEVQRLLEMGIKEQTDRTEVQFFVLDEGCLCGVANEIMCEFALNVWQKVQNEYCYFGGYTNGCTGYFPTEEEFDMGGYEVYWSMLIYYKYHARVFPLNRESASELIDFVSQNVSFRERKSEAL